MQYYKTLDKGFGQLDSCSTCIQYGVYWTSQTAVVLQNALNFQVEMPNNLKCCVQAIRAPLIVAVLESYYSIHNEAWTNELQAIFPHLAKLVCSAQPTVRKALGQLMQANLPYALADVPS